MSREPAKGSERVTCLPRTLFREKRRVTRAVLLQQLLRNVDRVLVLGVAPNVFQDIHRLQRLGERPAALAQLPIARWADRPRVLMPEIGEHVANGPCYIVAILTILLDALDADSSWVAQDESPHSSHHLGDPVPHVCSSARRKRMELGEDEVCVAVESYMRAVAADVGARGDVTLRGATVVEASQQEIQ